MVVRGRTRNAIGPQGRVGSTPTISARKSSPQTMLRLRTLLNYLPLSETREAYTVTADEKFMKEAKKTGDESVRAERSPHWLCDRTPGKDHRPGL